MTTDDYNKRFGGIGRLYGTDALPILRNSHICIVGLGGVGSWAVEALARSGIGNLTLIDFDIIEQSNINRQLPALDGHIGMKKSTVLAERINGINPLCNCQVIDDYLTIDNIDHYLATTMRYSYVIDAIDSISFKAHIIHYCKRNKIPIITTGGVGGLTDPTQIGIKDLSRTWNDPLAAKVRQRLRSHHNFPKNPKRYFGVECVFSTEQQRYPKDDGTVGFEKPGIHGVSLDCRFGYGAASFVTGTTGFVVASRAIAKILKNGLI